VADVVIARRHRLTDPTILLRYGYISSFAEPVRGDQLINISQVRRQMAPAAE